MKTVLVVEDLQAERHLISALLNHAGFKVAVADSVEAARQWLQTNPLPNLILLDIILPGVAPRQKISIASGHCAKAVTTT